MSELVRGDISQRLAWAVGRAWVRRPSLVMTAPRARWPFGASRFVQDHLVDQVGVLAELVLDLMMEVEALRAAAIGGTDATSNTTEARYAQAYRESASLTHNSIGLSPASDKLVGLFYPESGDSDGRSWRETLVLRRLGFTEEDIDQYKEAAKALERNT